jgi:HlyD family secretion protein
VTVDVALIMGKDAPPPGVLRPDLSVDGTIELQRLTDVVFIGRPALGQEQGAIGLFKVLADGTATRIRVKLGVSSVTSAQVLSGLNVGDQVILSDMSAWDAFDRIKLQ